MQYDSEALDTGDFVLIGAWTFGDLSDCVEQQLHMLQEMADEDVLHPPVICDALRVAYSERAARPA